MRSAFLATSILLLALCAPAVAADRYLQAGIPASTRVWSGYDYEHAVQILSEGKLSLPRFSDPVGAALLRRITSPTSFTLLRDDSLPMQQRMEDFLKMYQGTSALAKLYYAEPTAAGAPHQEIAALLAFLIQTSAVGVELVDQYLPTIAKDDQYETRMAGLKQMNSGLTTVFVGAEQTLGEGQGFSPDDLSVILEAMESALPKMKKVFPPEVRVELRKKLEADKKRFSRPEDAKRISSMIRDLAG